MALRDMIVNIVREVASELIEARFGSEPVVMEIARGPGGSINGHTNGSCWLKKVSVGSTDDTSPVILSDNYATPIQVGLKVLYGSRDGQSTKKEVLGLAYHDGGYMANGEKLSSVAKHGHTHGISTAFNSPYQIHSHDAITIGVPNIEPLRTRPSAAGGVAIDVEALEYRYDSTSTVFGGVTNLSLSAAIPGSGLQRFVAVYLDKATNTVKTANGSTIAIGAGRPPDPTISDTNIILSSYVRLKNGATSISVTDDISDQRDIIGGAVKISNVPYSNAGTGTQLTTDDDVALTADIQFQGDVLIGGDPGDSPLNSLHIGPGTVAPVKTGIGLYVASENANAQISVADVTNGIDGGFLVDSSGIINIGSWGLADVQFQANDTTYMTIEAAGGEIGVGTTSPKADFHINLADPVLLIQDTESTAASAMAHVVFAESDVGGDSEDAFRIGYNSGDFRLGYSSDDNNGIGSYTDLVTVDNAGNVGIGTASPGNNLVVSTSSDVGVRIDGAAGQVRDLLFSSSLSNRWIYRVDATAESGSDVGSNFLIMSRTDAGAFKANAFFIERSTGNVGINTTSPTARFTVDDPGGGAESNIRIRDGDATRYRSDWGVQASGAGVTFNAYDDTGADYIPLKIDGKNLLLNSASGDNVSINTTAAPARLTVDDPGGGAQSHIRIRDSDATRYRCDWAVLASGTGALINSYDDTGTTYLPFRIDANDLVLNIAASAGNVGIRTASPGAPLHVEQTGASTTEAVIKLVQANDTEDIFEIVGSSNSTSPLTRTLVDEGAQSTTTLEGWVKIVIQDDGTELTDSVYYMPFYTLA